MSTKFEVRYIGARESTKGSLVYGYQRVAGDGPVLCFKKPFKLFHRIGDVLEVEKDGEDTYRPGKEVLRHVDSPEDEVADIAAKQACRALAVARKLAGKSDLAEAMLPLQAAYRKLAHQQRAAFITWVVMRIESWN